MARVTITIEDTEHGTSVQWDSDVGVLSEDGTQAEQIAFYVLKLLAKAGDVDLPVVETGGEPN